MKHSFRIGVAHPHSQSDARSFGLPDDLVAQSVRRTGWLALIVGGILLVALVSNAIATAAGGFPMPLVSVVIRVVGILGCAGLVLVFRYSRLPTSIKCDLGLGFEVMGAFFVGMLELTTLPAWDMPVGTISSVALWILVFRMLVPATSTRALVTSLLSAATIGLAIVVTDHVYHQPLSTPVVAALYKTTFLSAIIGWLASRTLYRIGTAVSAARMMGSYKLERLLGKGGMGEVWLGSHAMLKRPAAIKLIHTDDVPGVGSGDGSDATTRLQRFEREARATAALRSKHTVHLYDYGVSEDGTFFYVMEYLEGIDLDTLVERYGPVPAERVVFLLSQACHSLMDAHAQGLIHRDIKPSNLRLCRLGPDYDFVKVLDFGLVKQLDASDEKRDRGLTVEGLVTGTPAYMAPELALGNKEDIGPATDVYMLGCVGYWLLTGRLVFEGKTAMAVMSGHIHTEPQLVSERTELYVPPALESLIMDCLKKEPAERPATAHVMRDRLANLDLAQAREWTPARAERWWQVHTPTADDAVEVGPGDEDEAAAGVEAEVKDSRGK
jgi:eukaryotic-like serine/threonine-protein kinase